MSLKSEEICKRCFHKYLTKELRIKDVKWFPGKEPPDYYIEVNNVKYAVEQTNIIDRVSINSKDVSFPTIIFSLRDFLREVEKEAKENDILMGTYAVAFSRPIVNLSKFKNSIKENIIKYVKRTKFDSCKYEEVIFKQENGKVTIIKQNKKLQKIGIGGPPISNWPGSKQEALNLIQDRITVKLDKLSGIKLPKILLLLNEHLFYDISDYKDLVAKLKYIKEFHTIFIVENETRGYALYSNVF